MIENIIKIDGIKVKFFVYSKHLFIVKKEMKERQLESSRNTKTIPETMEPFVK